MKQFKYVLTIAKAGTISKAAEELNISQPSLSQYVKKIEKELDIELFVRTNGNCRLTDAGKVYVETGRQILSLEQQMKRSFLDIKEHKTGTITVGTTPFRSAVMMPAIVSRFKKRYPGIHMAIVEQGMHELKEAAERGEFDICIVNMPVEEKVFKVEPIMEEEMVLAVPKGSKLDVILDSNAKPSTDRKFASVDVDLIDGHEFIMLTEAQTMQKALSDLCRDSDVSLKTAAVVKSLEAQLEMVRMGIGAALIPTGLIKFGGGYENINYYSLSHELPKRKVAVIYRNDKPLSIVVKNLITDIKSIDW